MDKKMFELLMIIETMETDQLRQLLVWVDYNIEKRDDTGKKEGHNG